MPSRKDPVIEVVSEIHPKRILEVGVRPGGTALKMIKEAQEHCASKSDVKYYGFDLFGPLIRDEFDQSLFATLEDMRAMLEPTGAEVHLIKGDSRVTLPEFVKTAEPMDFIYIDGGHSFETVASDWVNCKSLMHPKTVVMFDDYWDQRDGGCRAIIDTLDRTKYEVIIYEPGEFIKDWRLAPSFICRAVKVTRRSV